MTAVALHALCNDAVARIASARFYLGETNAITIEELKKISDETVKDYLEE
jgi:hypothetical protein